MINCVFKISFLPNVLSNYQFSILIDRYRCVHHELLSVAYGDSGERTDSLKPEMTVTQYCFFLLIWLQKKRTFNSTENAAVHSLVLKMQITFDLREHAFNSLQLNLLRSCPYYMIGG